MWSAGGSGARPLRTALLSVVVVAVVAGAAGVLLSQAQRPSVAPHGVQTSGPRPSFPTVGPVSTSGYVAVDDGARNAVVLFGAGDQSAETWTWTGSWQAVPVGGPGGRSGATAAYDPGTGQVLLYGGVVTGGAAANDTWAWDGSAWTEVQADGAAPPPGNGALMAWDAGRGVMVLVTPGPADAGLSTWTWSGSAWVRQVRGDAPASPIAAQLASDPVSGALILVTSLRPPTGDGPGTWSWDGTSWQALTIPTPVATTGLAVNPADGHLALLSNPTAATPARLWSWQEYAWSPVPQSSLTIASGVEVTDLRRSRLLIVGVAAPADLAPQAVEVWAWNGQAWTGP